MSWPAGRLPRFTETELDRVARRVAMDSAGLPLLVVELLHAVALGLDLRQSDGAWPSPLRTLSDTLPGDLPDAVVAAIRIGFRRLTTAAQRVLGRGGGAGGPREQHGSGAWAAESMARRSTKLWTSWNGNAG